MKYITEQIVRLVSLHEPDSNGETMILVNGFEDLRVYNQVARLVSDRYKSSILTSEIKLAGKKWHRGPTIQLLVFS